MSKAIKDFNKLYGLPVPDVPTLPGRADLIVRLKDFTNILTEEVNEVTEICNKIHAGDMPAEVLAELADWLGDIQVYCASEIAKFGLDNELVLGIIMASNMSKLDANGKPIYDERGKVLKGPNYWRPEPQIKRYIEAAWRQHAKQQAGGSSDADDQS